MKAKNRRDFLKGFAWAAGAAVLAPWVAGGRSSSAWAKEDAKKSAKDIPLPAGEKKVNEADALPSALGFKHDVKDIDYTRFPKRKEKAAQAQHCENCALYTKVNDGWGKCTMMTNAGVVSAKGWCGSWSKKA